jgi:hypothetical protein
MVEDFGDDEQVRHKKKAFEIEALQEKDNLRKVLDTYEGRAFLWRILSECGIYQAADIKGIERFEGKRDIGLWLVAEIHNVGDWYPKMTREAVIRGERRQKTNPGVDNEDDV